MNNNEIAQALADLQAGVAALAAVVNPTEPAKVQAPAEPKAEVRFRSQKACDAGRAKAEVIWTAHKAKAGVKRVSQLTPAQKKAAQAEVTAMWKGVKGTRKTKVA